MNIKMSPVTITGETMAVLRHEKNYSDLLALYITYAEVTQWQNTNRIKATGSFMQKRMGWGRDRLIKNKKRLVELDLIANTITHDGKKISGHFIDIKYVIATPLKIQHVAKTDTSAYRKKDKVLRDKKIASGDGASSDADDSSLNKTEIKPRKSSAPNPTINALHYQVIKKYALPVSNHNEVRAKSKRMEQEVGYDKAIAYLQSLLDNDYESVTGKFKPSLDHSRDIYDKRKKIEVFLYENTNRYL